MLGRKPKSTSRTSRGMRLTEGLLPIFGPAQIGDSTTPVRPANAAEQQRDSTLRTELTRVVGPDGHSYVVAVPVDDSTVSTTDDTPAVPPASA
ncbi:hypothetical protein [Sanguibacter antarcticus]|uniref:Uncharacterized protein n=1 Tax=Sanguibacter antarcticus TaxID=372484 RepID=A0A2A9EAA8_9MICO|nr:hypothetical protein [Sanguibacter antarcticus]PFG35205.1 hypothetical protein ATL42_3143 [Sanguibacter antarcticus]